MQKLIFAFTLLAMLTACGADNRDETASSSASSSNLSSSISNPSSASSSGVLSAQFEENDNGFCGGAGTREAVNSGFSGDGYFNSNNATGAAAVWRINTTNAENNSVLTWRFANGGANARPATVEVNGNPITVLDFEPTGAWDNWQPQEVTIKLSIGDNEIRLTSTTAEGLANIDWLQVSGNELVTTGTCPQPTTACMASGIHSSDIDIASLLACDGDPAVCLLGGGVGNYRVAMAFDAAYSGELEIFAESRRRMYSAPGQSDSNIRCVDILVNVRDPEGEPYSNDRGTPGLNLRITKGANALQALSVSPASNSQVLFIAGDSTVADQSPQLQTSATSRFTGWGQFIPAYFNKNIAVSNYADSGESTAAFRTDGGGLWNPINARLKAGDWVMIQLGHNDKTTSGSLYRSRITNLVAAIRNKGAHPILITPMVRNTGDGLNNQHIWGDLNIRNELIGISKNQNVPLIDLMKLTSEWVNRIGQSTAQGYFVNNDRTHSNELGAELFAQMIVNEISRQNIGIVEYFRER